MEIQHADTAEKQYHSWPLSTKMDAEITQKNSEFTRMEENIFWVGILFGVTKIKTDIL